MKIYHITGKVDFFFKANATVKVEELDLLKGQVTSKLSGRDLGKITNGGYEKKMLSLVYFETFCLEDEVDIYRAKIMQSIKTEIDERYEIISAMRVAFNDLVYEEMKKKYD
jgi:hypothetical protein